MRYLVWEFAWDSGSGSGTEKNSTKQKNSCTPRGVIDSFSSIMFGRDSVMLVFSDISMPDHTRRRCDHAHGETTPVQDRIGVG